METVRSKDGTAIAFDRLGKGPALVLVGGSFEHRALWSETAKLAVLPLMGEHFTLFHYDRRGRGDSTNTPPYAVRRAVFDLEAVIDGAGRRGVRFLALDARRRRRTRRRHARRPQARSRKHTHEVSPEALGPVLVDFFFESD